MKNTDVAKVLAAAPATLSVVHQKNWVQLQGQLGAKAYVSQANKGGVCTRVHLSGWGYAGLPAALQLPAEAVKRVDDNGAVSMEVNLVKAPKDWLGRLAQALDSIQPEQDPRRQPRRGVKAGAKPASLAELLAASRAPAPASAPASEVVTLDDMLALQGGDDGDDSAVAFADDAE